MATHSYFEKNKIKMLCKSKNTYLGSLVHFLCGLWGRREPLHLGLMVGGLRSLGLLKCQSGDFPVVRTPVSSRDLEPGTKDLTVSLAISALESLAVDPKILPALSSVFIS